MTKIIINMKYVLLCISLIWILTSCGVSKLDTKYLSKLEPVVLYETSMDFLSQKPMQANAGVLIKKKSRQHITVHEIYDLSTGASIKRGTSAWALKYRDTNYLNLGYASDINTWYSFAKFDIEGKYCLVFVDTNSPKALQTSNQGMGLTMALTTEVVKARNNWYDAKGNKYKIVFIDTDIIVPKQFSANKSARGEYLSEGQFEDIIEKYKLTSIYDLKSKDDPKLEQVIEAFRFVNGIK